MPVARFQMPDGRIGRFEVPDGTTPEQAQALIQQSLGAQEAESPAAPPPETQTRTDRFVKGLRDPIDAGAQLLTNALPEGVVTAGNRLNNWLADKTGLVGRLPEGGVDQHVREGEQAYQQARAAAGGEGFDAYRALGNLVSPANVAVASRLPAAATLSGRVATGAAGGALFGALSPVAEGDFAEQKAKQMGMGAAVGGVLPAVTGGVARVVSPNASRNPNVALLQQEGVQPTIGQALGGRMNALEEKLQSVPLVGDRISIMRQRGLEQFNRAAINRATAPVGKEVDAIGREGVAQAKGALKQAYDDLLPKMRFDADVQFSADLSRVQSMVDASLPRARGHMAPPGEADIFDNIIHKQIVGKMTPAGTMSGETFKQVESEISRLAKGYMGDPSFDKRQIGAALTEVLAAMRASLQRANPDQAAQLAQINKGFANFARVRDAASRVGAEEGVFTPAQLQSAVRSADKSAGKGSFATGNAFMQDLSEAGKAALGSKVPNSFTTDRALIAGGALGSYFVNPAIPAGLIAASGLYTVPAQNALRFLLTARPQAANALANSVRNASPMLLPGGAGLGAQMLEQ